MSKVTMYLDEEAYAALKRDAEKLDRSVSWILKKAVEKYLGGEIKPEPKVKVKVNTRESQRLVIAAQAEDFTPKPEKRKNRARACFLLKNDCPLTTCKLRAVPGHFHFADEMTLEDWLVVKTLPGAENPQPDAEARWYEANGLDRDEDTEDEELDLDELFEAEE